MQRFCLINLERVTRNRFLSNISAPDHFRAYFASSLTYECDDCAYFFASDQKLVFVKYLGS